MKFLQNTWYVAALSDEVGAEQFFDRKILGVSVLMYRKRDGEPVALHDRCPHRFAPLHLGKRVDDDVVCPYHALRFDCSGQCVHSPHGEGHIPKAAQVRSFPVTERHGFIWLWPGNPALADESLIPDFGRLTDGPVNSVGYGYMHMPANYEIVVDNIMDLSHVDVVHGPLLSTAGKLSPLVPKVEDIDGVVTIRWEWQQQPPMGFFAPFLPAPQAEAEQWVQVEWQAPACMLLTVGAVQGSRDYDKGLVSWDHHIMTPETATTTHYFFGSRRNWLVDDADFNRTKLEGTLAAFATEDKPLITAVQQEMGTIDIWSLKPVMLSSDPGAIRARRKLLELIKHEEEQGSASMIPLKVESTT